MLYTFDHRTGDEECDCDYYQTNGNLTSAPVLSIRTTVSLPKDIVYAGPCPGGCRIRFWNLFDAAPQSAANDHREQRRSVVLPPNWTFKPMSPGSTKWILTDEHQRRRAIVYHYHQNAGAYMQLCRRYNWQCVTCSEGTCFVQVVDADHVLFQSDSSFCRRQPRDSALDEMTLEATDWLNHHYPDWQDPTAYW